MKRTESTNETLYGPLRRKSFAAALCRELCEHIPSLGALTARALAEHIEAMVDQYFPPTERLRPGQMMWPAVDEHECAGYGKRIEQTRLKPVLLNVRTDQDIQDKIDRVPARRIRQQVAVRLFDQAKAQGGVLTGVDVAAIMGLTPNTISRYVRAYEQETGRLVPRRGTLHDMGPTLTHKREICRLVIAEGRSIETTARATHHSPEAVTRYVQDWRRVDACMRQGMSVAQTAYATKMSKRLVEQYIALRPPNPSLPDPKEKC